ncbi:hypothetical protein M9458_041128, partial [Cirrhinus mrigala]
DPAGFGGVAYRRVRRQQQADRSEDPAAGRAAGGLPAHIAAQRGQQAAVAAHRLLQHRPEDIRARRLRR